MAGTTRLFGSEALPCLLPYVLGSWIIVALLAVLYRAALPKPLPGIPYNQESVGRIFGDLKDMRKAKYRRQWIWSQPRQHGAPLSQAFLFPFRRPTVIVSDYRTAVDICSRRIKEFDRGTRNRECVGVTAPNFHFTMESRDPRFRMHREILRDLMSPWFLNEVAAPRVYDKAALLVDLWRTKQSKAHDRPFAAGHDLYLATLDMISSVAFGMEESKSALKGELYAARSFNPSAFEVETEPVCFPPAPEDPEMEALMDIPDMIAVAQASPFPALAQWLALLKPKHARAHWHRRALLKRQTERCLYSLALLGDKNAPDSALHQLLWREKMAASRAGRRPDFYSPAIRDEVLGYLLGGHDTTATLLAWWTKYMMRYQDVQARLRQALREAHPNASLEGRPPTMSEISSASVPYLDAVLEETLRCASVATLIVRKATCDTEIHGYHIPKGTDVVIPLTGPSLTEPALEVSHSSREKAEGSARVSAWSDDDIEQYKPERWLRTETDALGQTVVVFDAQAGPNLAFSTGPRQCFGKKQALLQIKTTVSLLLWEFQFEPVEGSLGGWEIQERLVNLPKHCYVKLSKA
ncbi:cytochrome P450 monooxygenase [Purpureocillium lilacinum]|uniref:Cytochrome P450 monooxygenase n=1 Tax=Purpureocillium lilacinum TaxID=33203 RepID=A0A179G3A2_PURLI|nr:cytochrome P450 monooxygenase [Purpureocillium lilacinum]OAQ71843.1 cytochrome P450 monooxygenase [Purpureocillium lilacinum]OAQ92914.1 cytochrome P450 monooxygenase [Purpureocillium lilacinum]